MGPEPGPGPPPVRQQPGSPPGRGKPGKEGSVPLYSCLSLKPWSQARLNNSIKAPLLKTPLECAILGRKKRLNVRTIGRKDHGPRYQGHDPGRQGTPADGMGGPPHARPGKHQADPRTEKTPRPGQ